MCYCSINMKLGEKRVSKEMSVKLLAPEQKCEPYLNERLGIDEKIKVGLLQVLEQEYQVVLHESGLTEEEIYEEKVKDAVELLILFPEERELITTRVDLNRLERLVRQTRRYDLYLSLKKLSPDRCKTIPIDQREIINSLNASRDYGKGDPTRPQNLIIQALEKQEIVRAIIQNQKQEVDPTLLKQALQKIQQWEEEKWYAGIIAVAASLVKADPTQQVKIHAIIKAKESLLISWVQQFEKREDFSLSEKLRILAGLKLLLAHEVEVLSTGMVVPVDRKRVGGGRTPLPEREVFW